MLNKNLLSKMPRFIFSIKTLSLVVLSLQTTTMVLMLRYSRTLNASSHFGSVDEDGKSTGKSGSSSTYIISTAIFIAELLKLLVSLSFLQFQNGFRTSATITELHEEIVCNVTETFKMIIPAGLYLLQNNLLFVALSNLDAATYQVTYQLRILCTAAFSWLLLGRRLSLAHWLALACLMVGVALVQVDAGNDVKAISAAPRPLVKMDPPVVDRAQFLIGNRDDDQNINEPSSLNIPNHGLPRIQEAEPVGESLNPILNSVQQPKESREEGGIQGPFRAFANAWQRRFGEPEQPLSLDAPVENVEATEHDEPSVTTQNNLPPVGVEAGVIKPGSAAVHLQKLHEKALLDQASSNKEVSWLLGLLSVLVSCILSSFSGVYFERLVKRSRQTSLLIRNIQLGIFSILFSLLTLIRDRQTLWEGGFFQGYNWATWSVIVLQACSGLVVSVTMKYADNILKVFATSVSIVLSTLLSTTVLGHSAPSLPFVVGTTIVLGATVLYALAPTPASASAIITPQERPKPCRSPPSSMGGQDLSYALPSAPTDCDNSRSRSNERILSASQQLKSLSGDPGDNAVDSELWRTRSSNPVSLFSSTVSDAKVSSKDM